MKENKPRTNLNMKKKENKPHTDLNMKKVEPYIWLLPSILLMGVMILVPIFSVFQTSFSEISKSGVNKGFNGGSNYLWVFQNTTFWNTLWEDAEGDEGDGDQDTHEALPGEELPGGGGPVHIAVINGGSNYLWVFQNTTFWNTLWNTVVWTIVVVGLSTILGIILGLVLNEKFHGRKIVRAIVVFPWATALIIQSVIWKYIINADYGALNALLLPRRRPHRGRCRCSGAPRGRRR